MMGGQWNQNTEVEIVRSLTLTTAPVTGLLDFDHIGTVQSYGMT
jgi:hypothetical protein